jgi:predicted metalloprotease with PDZ domain
MIKTLILSALFYTTSMMAQTINYNIQIKDPNSHYATVKMEISGIKAKQINVKLPVWTPGSYMVREFSRNVGKSKAYSGNETLTVQKSDKNTWTIQNPKNLKSLTFEYEIYAFEAGVRTTYIDNDHAFILPTSCLMFVDGSIGNKGQLKLEFPIAWHRVSTTLKRVSPYTYEFDNYDDLADSPIEIGNHDELTFNVAGVPHKVALVGENNCPKEKFTKDLKTICEGMLEIVGTHPSKEYLFIIHHVEEGGGGLEHSNSNVVQFRRYDYTNEQRYKSFLSLCGHEYFHLWNVKRIRPAALGPFNYNQENYTNLLWVAEGITSYYDELIMYRTGFWTQAEYLKSLSSSITATMNRQGAYHQSLHEASFDAWIKEYRPNENSINSQISYYLKGAVVAAILDIEIIKATNGQKNLDDLMKYLYNNFYLKQNKGFTDAEFYAAINTVAGKNIDMKYWVEQANSAEMLEKMQSVFSSIALQLDNTPNKNQNYTGIIIEIKGEKTLIKSVELNSPAMASGLQAGDELIAINNIRIKNNFEDLIKLNTSNSQENILISRAGLIKTISVTKIQDPKFNLTLKIKESTQLNAFWLKTKL